MPGVFWRPAVSIFLKLEWLAFHLHFTGYRATSCFLCALTALCIYCVLHKLTASRSAGITAAAFFVAWPSHPETIVWIAGQTDGLATAFAWLALWAFVSYWTEPSPRWSRVPLWLVPLILALLAKESVIVMPFLLLVIAIAVRPKAALQEQRLKALFLALVATALTFGYLWLRSKMIHQPLFGGGYVSASGRGLLGGIYDGFLDYHLSLNLLNAYLPLSSRVAQRLDWTPDAFVLILATFGPALILRRLAVPIASLPRKTLALVATLLFLCVATLAIVGVFPFEFVASLAAIPSGLAAITGLVALCAYFIFRSRESIRAAVSKLAEGPFIPIASTLLAAYALFHSIQGGTPHGLPLFLLFGYWLVMYSAGRTSEPRRDESLAAVALLMMVASVLALIPVLTIRQVDANLANARFAYLATTFSVPAIVAGLCVIFQSTRGRQVSIAISMVIAGIALIPIIRTWGHSTYLSARFEEAIQQSKARRVYVLASPGFIPSATTVILGGDALDASGRLFRDDRLPVFPGYYADGFTEGDRLTVAPLNASTWNIQVFQGNNVDRSGSLSILPCYGDFRISTAYKLVAKNHLGTQEVVGVSDPLGEVLAVDENGVRILRR